MHRTSTRDISEMEEQEGPTRRELVIPVDDTEVSLSIVPYRLWKPALGLGVTLTHCHVCGYRCPSHAGIPPSLRVVA